MRKHLTAVILGAFAFVAVVGVVGPAAAGGGPDIHWWSEGPSTTRTITGVVKSTDHGLSLFTSDGQEYILAGKDLSSEVGEKISVTGKVSKSVGENPEIKVKSFTLM